MSVFSSGRLAFARARARRWMPDSCQIVARVLIETADGGSTLAETVGETLPCRVVARDFAASEGSAGGRAEASTYWQVYLPWDAVVYPEDAIQWNGETFEVRDSNSDRSDLVTVVANVVRRRKRPAVVLVAGPGIQFNVPGNSMYLGI